VQSTAQGQSATGLTSFVLPAPASRPSTPPPVPATPAPVAVASGQGLPAGVDSNLLLGMLLVLVLAVVTVWYLAHGQKQVSAPATQPPFAPPPDRPEPTLKRGDRTEDVDGVDDPGRTMRRRQGTPPQVRLTIVQQGQPTEFASRDSPITFGRAKGRVTVFIQDPLVSSEHARIRREGTQFLLEDLASKNGTQLNGEPITPGAPRALKNTDQIHLGDTVVTFLVDTR
jgi:hypothetical protein